MTKKQKDEILNELEIAELAKSRDYAARMVANKMARKALRIKRRYKKYVEATADFVMRYGITYLALDWTDEFLAPYKKLDEGREDNGSTSV